MPTYIPKSWRLLFSALISLAFCIFLPKSALSYSSQELLAFFGLLMAGVLPTMVLAASSLRAGKLSKQRIQSFHDALLVQMRVWAGLFLVSPSASLVVIFGKAVSWTIPLYIESVYLKSYGIPAQVDLIYVINFVVLFCLALLASRAISISNGLRSLLRLSAEIAISESEENVEAKIDRIQKEVRGVRDAPGRANYVDLPN